MDWLLPIDRYCERLDGGLWAEPFNLLSNGAFFVAFAIGLWRWYRMRNRAMPLPLGALFGLLLAIGIGSSLFHSFANRWSEVADVVPIALFVVTAWGVVMRTTFGWPWGRVAGGYGFLVLATALGFLVPKAWFNGSNGYFGAVATLSLAAIAGRKYKLRATRWLLWSVPLFGLALVFRSIDQGVCAQFPLGTHFLWHSCVAGVACLLLLTAVDSALRLQEK